MKGHYSSCWLAAGSGLSGSAQLARGKGKRQLAVAPATGLVVPNAVKQQQSPNLSPHLLQLSLSSHLHGTLSAMTQRASIHIGSFLAANWVSSCCSRGQPHHWKAVPSICMCAGRQACVCNSLESVYQCLAAEFDVDKNKFAPSEVTASPHRKA